MADIIKSIMDAYMRSKYSMSGDHPDVRVAQDRYMQTPIFIQPQNGGIGAHYESQGNPSQTLADNINYGPQQDPATLKGLDNLVNSWKNKKGLISAGESGFGLSGETINHEVAHRIYDLAGLKNKASSLLPSVPQVSSNQIKESPTYSNMGAYSGSPEQITDEGLGFSFTSPSSRDEQYVKTVADYIKDPNLKSTLIRMFANRLAIDGLNSKSAASRVTQ